MAKQSTASYRVGELVGDELPHQRDGRRPLLSNLKRRNKLSVCVCDSVHVCCLVFDDVCVYLSENTHLTLDRPQVGIPEDDKQTLALRQPDYLQIQSALLIGGRGFTYLTPGSSCCWVMSSESSSDPPE